MQQTIDSFDRGKRIVGESYFETLPKNYRFIEDEYKRFDESIIWPFNDFFWRYSRLWEKTYGEYYEESLPGGVSLSHTSLFIDSSVSRFIKLVESLYQENRLPGTIYIMEKGIGSGAYALGFLDRLQAYCHETNRDFYDRLRYLMVDTSTEMIESALAHLEQHSDRMVVTSSHENRNREVLFIRHGNFWDQLPGRLFKKEAGGLFEVYSRAVVDDDVYSKFFGENSSLVSISEESIASRIIEYPMLWKPFVQSLKLMTREKKMTSDEPCLSLLGDMPESKIIVYNSAVLADLKATLNQVDWNRGGYMEIMDIIPPTYETFPKSMFPKKYDGALGVYVNGVLISNFLKSEHKVAEFTQVEKLNYCLTIQNEP